MDSSEIGRQLQAMRKSKEVICPVCGTKVIGKGRRQYCSTKCQQHAAYLRRRETSTPVIHGDTGEE